MNQILGIVARKSKPHRARRGPSFLVILLASANGYAGQEELDLSTHLNFDAGIFFVDDAAFGASEDVFGEEVTFWHEHGLELSASLSLPFSDRSHLSLVGSGLATWTSGGLGQEDPERRSAKGIVDIEEAFLWWKIGELQKGEDRWQLDAIYGRTDYKVGRQMMFGAGRSEGTEGSLALALRSAWDSIALFRLSESSHMLEAVTFTRQSELKADVRISGFNYEGSLRKDVKLGLSYFLVNAPDDRLRNRLSIYNIRGGAYKQVMANGRLSFFIEAAAQTGQMVDGHALSISMQLDDREFPFSSLSYRYAKFSGDVHDTAKSEAFDPLFAGFYDWGTWFQGEVFSYGIDNSNLVSHTIKYSRNMSPRLHLSVLAYSFRLQRPLSVGPPSIRATTLGREIDFICDWSLTETLYIGASIGIAFPGRLLKELGGTSAWTIGALYVSYSLW